MNYKLLLTLTVVLNSFALSARTWTTNSDRFNFQREFIENSRFNSDLNTLYSILQNSDEGYDFVHKLEQLGNEYDNKAIAENTELEIDYAKTHYSTIMKSSPEAKTIADELKKLKKEYKQISEKLKTIKLEHDFIERMNCKTNEAECYNLRYNDHWRMYRLSFFSVLNYLIANYDQYLADEAEFKESLITDLEIEDKLRETLKDKYNCWQEDCSAKMRVGLNTMLIGLSEFVADQKSYQALIAKEKEAIASELGLDITQIQSSDSFSEDAIGYPKGEFVLDYSLAQYSLDRSSMDYSPIVEYLESIKLDDLVKTVK